MGALIKTDFDAKYGANTGGGALFKDNTAGDIGANDMRSQAIDIKDSFLNILDDIYKKYAVTASGTDTYTATPSPTLTAYTSGDVYYILFTNANTGAATLNLNALGAKAIRKNGATALVAGDIAAGQVVALAYDGTNLQIVSGTSTGTVPTLASGTYTPTLTNTTNVAASTAYQCQYMRVGSVVTVSGRVDIDPTTAGIDTAMKMSLPIASNFGNNSDCGGTAFSFGIAGLGAAIEADNTSDVAYFHFVPSSNAYNGFFFSFTYSII